MKNLLYFCGCGTTLKVAKDLRRNYIGIDQNKQAIGICKKRLKGREHDLFS